MDIPTLETIVTGLISGGATYPALRYLFTYLSAYGYLTGLSKNTKRWIALFLSFALAAAGLTVGLYVYGIAITPESLWTAGSSAFLASQMLHSVIEKRGRRDKGSPTSLPR